MSFDVSAMNQAIDAIVHSEARVAVVGSLNADLRIRVSEFPKAGETISGSEMAISAGGKSANQAVMAALLGARTTMIGAVGDDPYGVLLTQSLHTAGVDVDQVLVRNAVATGMAVITVADNGENTIVLVPGANGTLQAQDVSTHQKCISQAAALGLCLEIPTPAVMEAARLATESKTTVVLNFSPIVMEAIAVLPMVDVLVVNEHELAQLDQTAADTTDIAVKLRRVMHRYGIDRAVVTLGAAGSIVAQGDLMTDIPAVAVTAVDTTGCGDAYLATVLAGIAAQVDLVPAAQLAAAVAAMACRGVGAQNAYPTSASIRQYLVSRNAD